MAQAEPSNVTASGSGSEDRVSGSGREADYSGVAAGDEFVTAVASTSTASESCDYVSAGMSELQIRDAIEISREQGWSELKDGGQDGAAASSHAENALVWEELKKWNPRVFADLGERLKLGRVIAEGGQAHILEASLDGGRWDRYVAKVFKMEGFSLAELRRHWPLNTKAPPPASQSVTKDRFVLGGVVFGETMYYCSPVDYGTFLKDGRFVFVMPRYWGDLRRLINLKLKDNNSQGPPFSHLKALFIMYEIAMGVRDLHARGVLHRDLKAANVLIVHYGCDPKLDEEYICEVADFESAMLVQGTGFWRPPEVLEELMKQGSDQIIAIWTEKVDAYSYAMTCYEVLTGDLPFDGFGKSNWKRVIDGERPCFLDYVDPRLCKLVERCWHKEPSRRPTFEVIVAKLDYLLESYGLKSIVKKLLYKVNDILS